ncbi:MAG: DinB family protein [Bacteroidota bacterium]
MIQKLGFFLIVFLFAIPMKSQELPYREIPEYPANYSSGNIMTRLIDGLGFRYYWATEGLTEKDLSYQPSESSRSVLQTLQHICSMSQNILNAPLQKPNTGNVDYSKYTYQELRKLTLKNLKAASEAVAGKPAADFENYPIIYQRGERESRFPYWNLINGMISDCIYHTGQITLLRRVTGNPINPNVNVFTGKVKSN